MSSLDYVRVRTIRIIPPWLVGAFAVMFWSSGGLAAEPAFHFKLEKELSDAQGGFDAEWLVPQGHEEEPKYDSGHEGSSLLLSGNAALGIKGAAKLEVVRSSYCLEFWVKVLSLHRPFTVFAIGYPKSVFRFSLLPDKAIVDLSLHYYDSISSPDVKIETAETALLDGSWHRVAVVVDRARQGEIRLYVDGKLVSDLESSFLPEITEPVLNTAQLFVIFGFKFPSLSLLAKAAEEEPDNVLIDEVALTLEVPEAYRVQAELSPEAITRSNEVGGVVLKKISP